MKTINLVNEESVLKTFIDELEKELNIEFYYYRTQFSSHYLTKNRIRHRSFSSVIYELKNDNYELSFIPHSNGSVELWKINVSRKGKGLGTQLMNQVLDVSDSTGIDINLV